LKSTVNAAAKRKSNIHDVPLFIELLGRKEIPQSIVARISASSTRSVNLEAMTATSIRMQIALDAHHAQLLPDLHGIHRRIDIGIAMQKAHWRRIGIERKLRNYDCLIRNAAIDVGPVGSIS
jgi:hypothetical protein